MARVQNTLIGKSSGSVGGATFTTWKGINVLKSKAVVVKNPKTQLQRNQRQRMSLLVSLFRQLTAGINKGFSKLADKKSAYNAFTQANLLPANFTGAAPTMVLDHSKVLTAKGTIGKTPINPISMISGDTEVGVSWNPSNIPLGGSADDTAIICALNVTTGVSAMDFSEQRSSGGIDVSLPVPVATGNKIELWVAFKNPTTGEVSNSFYVAKTI